MEKFFMIYIEGEENSTTKYLSKEYAETVAQHKANELHSKVFVLEANSVITSEEANVIIDSYEAAVKYLGRKRCVRMQGIADEHAKAMSAMYQLITIAEAWNKADKFVPDFNDADQYKWFPWFEKKSNKDFVYSFVDDTVSYTGTNLGVRLCFKTAKRAQQFGEQFINLWNDFLL